MENTPLVTVACATYNHEKYIKQTLDGFLMQKTTFPVEFIIHDDCSTDNTMNIIREYQEKYPEKIKLITQEQNQYSQGISVLKQFLYPNIHSKYVALCEGDDYWTSPDKLQKQITYMEEHPECSCTYHAVNYLKDNEIIKNDCYYYKERDISIEQIIKKGGSFCATLSLCGKAEFMKDYPKFREIADVGDYPMQILMALRGKMHYFPDIMGVYRVESSGSWTERMKNDKDKYLNHLNKEMIWMKELDSYTNYNYTNCIYEHLIDIAIFDLYEANIINKEEVNKSFLKLKFSIFKFKYLLKFKLKFEHPRLFKYLKKIKMKVKDKYPKLFDFSKILKLNLKHKYPGIFRFLKKIKNILKKD